jgi:hypothetical protein
MWIDARRVITADPEPPTIQEESSSVFVWDGIWVLCGVLVIWEIINYGSSPE